MEVADAATRGDEDALEVYRAAGAGLARAVVIAELLDGCSTPPPRRSAPRGGDRTWSHLNRPAPWPACDHAAWSWYGRAARRDGGDGETGSARRAASGQAQLAGAARDASSISASWAAFNRRTSGLTTSRS
ncbi:hypothetical protein GCM10010246_03430 [Streptomyces cuspidosporus]|uniref:Uncharacterized protein n=1 Tax=Streptomyces cuspidosporus TaxID=66882 RepID=A0ABN3FAM2_9ACTN